MFDKINRMDKKRILELRSKLVQINKAIVDVNNLLLEEFQEQVGFIDCGNGCKIPKPDFPDRVFSHNDDIS